MKVLMIEPGKAPYEADEAGYEKGACHDLDHLAVLIVDCPVQGQPVYFPFIIADNREQPRGTWTGERKPIPICLRRFHRLFRKSMKTVLRSMACFSLDIPWRAGGGLVRVAFLILPCKVDAVAFPG